MRSDNDAENSKEVISFSADALGKGDKKYEFAKH